MLEKQIEINRERYKIDRLNLEIKNEEEKTKDRRSNLRKNLLSEMDLFKNLKHKKEVNDKILNDYYNKKHVENSAFIQNTNNYGKQTQMVNELDHQNLAKMNNLASFNKYHERPLYDSYQMSNINSVIKPNEVNYL